MDVARTWLLGKVPVRLSVMRTETGGGIADVDSGEGEHTPKMTKTGDSGDASDVAIDEDDLKNFPFRTGRRRRP